MTDANYIAQWHSERCLDTVAIEQFKNRVLQCFYCLRMPQAVQIGP